MAEYERNLVLELLPLKKKWINWKTFIDNINGGQIVFECFHSPWGRNVEVTIDLYDNWINITKNNKRIKTFMLIKTGEKYKVLGIKTTKIEWKDNRISNHIKQHVKFIYTGYIKNKETFEIIKFGNKYRVFVDLFTKNESVSIIGDYSRLHDAKRGAENYIKKVLKFFK